MLYCLHCPTLNKVFLLLLFLLFSIYMEWHILASGVNPLQQAFAGESYRKP